MGEGDGVSEGRRRGEGQFGVRRRRQAKKGRLEMTREGCKRLFFVCDGMGMGGSTRTRGRGGVDGIEGKRKGGGEVAVKRSSLLPDPRAKLSSHRSWPSWCCAVRHSVARERGMRPSTRGRAGERRGGRAGVGGGVAQQHSHTINDEWVGRGQRGRRRCVHAHSPHAWSPRAFHRAMEKRAGVR